VLIKLNGGYICFVDADDALPQRALEVLYAATEGGKYDIVRGDVQSAKPARIFTADEYRRQLLLCHVVMGVWGGLFSKQLFNEHTLDIPRDVVKGEDWTAHIRLAFANEKPVRKISEVIYCYTANPASVTHTFSSSLAYEELFRPHLLASIPEAKRPLYEKELIETQIGAVWTIALGSHYADLSKPSAFAAQLREDIRRTHYPADFPTKLLLRAPSAAVVRLTKLFIRLRIKAAAIAHRIRRS